MSTRKYPYTYELKTVDGDLVTDKDDPLKATKQSVAKRILKLKYPKCEILNIKTKAHDFQSNF